MSRFLCLLFLFLTSCPSCDRAFMDALQKSKIKDSDVMIEQHGSFVGLACHPTCPPTAEVIKHIDALACTFKEYITLQEAWQSLKAYKIIFTNDDFGSKGRHSPDQHYILIYYPHPCPDRPQGLCGGVFDWEVGNAMMEPIMAKQGNYTPTEAQKYEFRKANDMFYACPTKP